MNEPSFSFSCLVVRISNRSVRKFRFLELPQICPSFIRNLASFEDVIPNFLELLLGNLCSGLMSLSDFCEQELVERICLLFRDPVRRLDFRLRFSKEPEIGCGVHRFGLFRRLWVFQPCYSLLMIWKAEVSEFDVKSEKTCLIRRYSPVKAVSDEGAISS